jgi:molybdenum cofactor cytidylyltransferase
MQTTDRTSVAAVVLAAGRGTRFGATKQLAEHRGRPLVLHAVETARAAGCDPVLVVVGHDADRVRAVLPSDVTTVDNPDHASGQASSLRAGVAAASRTDATALVVLLADQPGVPPEVVRRVVDAHAAGHPVVRARWRDRPGHPVLFDRDVWPDLARTRGDVGARDLLAELDVTHVEVDAPSPPDVDVPEDLADRG